MKRLLAALMIITACVFSQAVICFSEESASLSYQMEIEILENEQAAEIRVSVTYLNKTGNTLENLMFSVPANCLRRESTLPYDNDTLEKAFPFGYAPGGMDIKSIRVDGRDADWAVSGENEAYLRVPVSLENGKLAQMHHRNCEDYAFKMAVVKEDNSAENYIVQSDYFGLFIDAVIEFFETGVIPVPAYQTIGVIALIEAAKKACQNLFEWINV